MTRVPTPRPGGPRSSTGVRIARLAYGAIVGLTAAAIFLGSFI